MEDENFENYLDKPKVRSGRDYQPTPYEKFLRTLAYRFRDLLNTRKANSKINNEVVELIDFMIALRKADVSLCLLNNTAKLFFRTAKSLSF